MTRFAWHKPNPLLTAFFELCFGKRINPILLDSPEQCPENYVYILTDPHRAQVPNCNPHALIDCHIGSRLFAVPEITSWMNRLDCLKITFDPRKKGWKFYDLREAAELGESIKLDKTDTKSISACLITGPWESDSDLPAVLENHGLRFEIFDVCELENASLSTGENIINLLCHKLAHKSLLVNTAVEVSFPLIELIGAACGCQVVTTSHGSVYEYLGESAIYFRPFCKKSYASVVHSLKLSTSTVLINFSGTLGEKLRNDLNISMDDRMKTDEVLDKVEQLAFAGNFSEAENLLTAALKQDSACPRLQRAMGLILLTQGKTAEAKPWLLESYVLDPENPKTQCSLGILFMLESKYDKAEELLLRSVARSENPLVPIVKLVELAYKTERYETAINAILSYMSSKNEDNLDLKFTLAGLFFKAGRFSDASSLLQQILASNKDYEPAKHLLDMISQNQAGQSEQDEKSDARDDQANFVETVSDQSNRFDDEPSETIEISTEFEPSIKEVIKQAEKLKRHGNYQEAFDLLAKAYDPSIPKDLLVEIQFLMIENKVLLGDLRFFDANFDYFESTQASNPRWLSLKGVVSLLREDTNEAEAMFRRAISLDHNQDMAWAGLGLIEEFRENITEAAACYRKALSINPVNMRAVLGLTELAPKLGNFKEAFEFLTEYLERDPENSEIREARDKLAETMKQNPHLSV